MVEKAREVMDGYDEEAFWQAYSTERRRVRKVLWQDKWLVGRAALWFLLWLGRAVAMSMLVYAPVVMLWGFALLLWHVPASEGIVPLCAGLLAAPWEAWQEDVWHSLGPLYSICAATALGISVISHPYYGVMSAQIDAHMQHWARERV